MKRLMLCLSLCAMCASALAEGSKPNPDPTKVLAVPTAEQVKAAESSDPPAKAPAEEPMPDKKSPEPSKPEGKPEPKPEPQPVDPKTGDPKPKPVEPKPADPKPTEKPEPVSEEKAKAAEAAFEAGRKLFFQGDYKAAVDKLAEAAKTNPSQAAYKLLLAKALHYAGQDDAAAKLLAEIVAANPEHVEAGLELAELLSPEKQPDKVIALLEPLLKFKHDYPLYHLLGEAYYQKENLAKARGYFEEAAKLNPSADRDFYQLGNIYLSQKHFAKSATAYETAARTITTGALHFKLASVYFNLHNYLGTVTTAEVLGGEVGQIKNNLYLIDPFPGRKDVFYVASPKSAIYQASRARELGIEIFELQFLEANTWLSARRFAKADKIYAELESKVKKEDSGLFWFYWAQTALGLDEYDNYLARLDKAIAAQADVYKPMLADAYVTVAGRYQQRGNNKKFVEYLVKAVGASPLSARLHLALADAYWQAGEKKPAIEQYRLVLELEPDHPARVRLLNRIRGQEEPTLSAVPIAGDA